ncbi:Alkyl transferase [Aphelenchoides besseyi]|nr:Alkyl transferase [Aphelenchoides besseyi]
MEKPASLPWFGRCGVRLLNLHPIPRHVAFIMASFWTHDGNRRYARAHQLSSVVDGHAKGFDQLIRVVEWSIELGIQEVTVYAFSLENFKRSDDEVEGLQKLAKDKFTYLLKSKQLEAIGVRIRFFGNKNRFTEEVRKTMNDVEETTKKVSTVRFTNFASTTNVFSGNVNICVAYTSQDEIARGMQNIQAQVLRGELKPSQIDGTVFGNVLDTRDSLPVDVVIRTSGEKRLSDFLLWQSSNAFIHFDDVFWPDFNFWHFFKAIFAYQIHMIKQK